MIKIVSTFILFSTIVFSDCRQMYLSFHYQEGAEVAFEMEDFFMEKIIAATSIQYHFVKKEQSITKKKIMPI